MRQLLLLVLLAGGCAHASLSPAARGELADKTSSNWQERARLTARVTAEKYGPPDEIHPASLVWFARGGWDKTVVRDAPPPYSGSADAEFGVLEQTAVLPGGRKVTVKSDREPVNFLRANLAADVAAGRMDQTQAEVMERHFQELEAAGRKTGYLDSLRWKTP